MWRTLQHWIHVDETASRPSLYVDQHSTQETARLHKEGPRGSHCKAQAPRKVAKIGPAPTSALV